MSEPKIFINNENLIKFLDTNGISPDMLKSIYHRFRHLSYDFHSPEDVLRYLDKKHFLNKDQSEEILDLYGIIPKQDIDPNIISKYNQKAIEHFGTTSNFRLAGYILTTGEMLNFSYEGYKRDIDHRDISEVLDYVDTEISASEPLIEFMRYGNIRLTSAGFEISRNITQKQRSVLRRIINSYRNTELYVDIANDKGYNVRSFIYNGESPETIYEDIDNYFQNLL